MFKKLVSGLAFLSSVSADSSLSWHSEYPGRYAEFAEWQARFDKSYSSPEEEARRFLVWMENVLEVEEHNRGDHEWTQEVNHFADQTSEEFNSWANGLKFDENAKRTGTPFKTVIDVDSLPSSVDWRKKGIVNPVKNQAQCGSCWAFSTIASFEGQYALKHNLTSFSEQDLVDCVKGINGCCNGCAGGLMDPAFEYLKQSQKGGDDLEKDYKYMAKNGKCQFSSDGPASGGLTGHVDVAKGDLNALKTAVATVGTISIGVDASKGWQTYGGGLYRPVLPGILGCSSSPSALDHGVAIVGYNTDTFKGKQQSYWIVRNSWAESWGEQGYMYLAMENSSGKMENYCGIANAASYPTLSEES